MKHYSKAAKSTTLSEPLQSFQQQKDFSCASSPQLYGKRAAVWLSLWDRGGTLTRLNLLESFIFLHAESNASVLADDLGDAAELFLARIASWLRLSYLRLLPEGGKGRRRRQPPPNAVRGIGRSAASSRLVKAHNPPSNETEKKKEEGGEGDQEGSGGHSDRDKLGMASYGGGTPPPPSSAVTSSPSSPSSPLLALVKALTIFSRGSGFLAQLAECGVVAALIDCLKRSGGKGDGAGLEASASPPPAFAPLAIEEKKAILLLLLYLANAGRVYRELICDEEGVADLLVVLQREADAAVAALLTELFITLGNGVPRLGLHVQCGLLRLILAERAVGEGLAAIPPAESRPPPPPSPSILLRPPPLPPPLSSPPASPRRASPARGISSSREAPAAFALPSESFRESILQAARALRGLQLSYEARYFGGFAEPGEDARGGGGRWEEVPVIGLGGCHAMDRAEGGASASGEPQGLLRPVRLAELLEALFFLASHECSSRYRVEGSELLTLVAKNIHLTAPILNHCFDVLNDDRLSITDDEEDLSLIRQQRHQLCCGRTAVQVILSKPMTARRHALIMKLIAIRSAHLSLLKYLRMTDQSDTAAVLGCCLALQIVARASNAAQHAHMLAPAWLSERPDGENDGDDAIRKPNDAVEFDDEFAFSPGPAGGGASYGNALLRVGHTIRDALGDSLYQVVLYQQLSEEECFAMQRASRDAVFTVK